MAKTAKTPKTPKTPRYTAKETNLVLGKMSDFAGYFNRMAKLLATGVDAVIASATKCHLRVNTEYVSFKSFPDNAVRFSLTVHRDSSTPVLVYAHLPADGKKAFLTGNGTEYPMTSAGIRRMAKDILAL